MKLLLTSAGITNQSIADALFDMVGKKPENTSVVFVPTASNTEIGDKSWLIDDLIYLKNTFGSVDIADISAIGEEIWQPKFEAADILFFEGGNACHLMEWINKSGLADLLPALIKNKVYVGVSAGSMVMSEKLNLKILHNIYEENIEITGEMAGLGYVDFYFLPHLNNPYFKNLKENFIKEIVKDLSKKIYAMDDNSALKVVNAKVEAVSEGKWLLFHE
jgi:dipeptidase E